MKLLKCFSLCILVGIVSKLIQTLFLLRYTKSTIVAFNYFSDDLTVTLVPEILIIALVLFFHAYLLKSITLPASLKMVKHIYGGGILVVIILFYHFITRSFSFNLHFLLMILIKFIYGSIISFIYNRIFTID